MKLGRVGGLADVVNCVEFLSPS